MEVDLNNTACRVEQIHLGYTNFINICNDTVTRIDWTGLDWFAAICMGSIMGAVMLMFICGIFAFTKNVIFD